MADLNKAFNQFISCHDDTTRRVWKPMMQKRCDSCNNGSFMVTNDGGTQQICSTCGKKYYFPQNAVKF
jgi:hypothetical protein